MSDANDNAPKKQIGRPFVPGQIANPMGRPKGSRSKLGEAFVADLYASWQEHGIETLEKVRTERPADYVKVVASLLPKDVNLNVNALGDVEDGDLAALIATAREAIALAQSARAGAGEAEGGKPVKGVQTLQ